MFAVHPEVIPHLIWTLVGALALTIVFRLFAKGWKIPLLIGVNLAIIGCAYMLYFFRDPERTTPDNPDIVYAGADGKIMTIKHMVEEKHLKTEVVRVSIFLSLIDVHVNRAPISGTVTFCEYFPGARHFTFEEKSSDLNQRSEIVIRNRRLTCLVTQIVGPIARRIVFWLEPGQYLLAGERIGMMKFGSRLDIYIPAEHVDEILVKPGDFVQAGVTPVIRLKPEPAEPVTAPAEAEAVEAEAEAASAEAEAVEAEAPLAEAGETP